MFVIRLYSAWLEYIFKSQSFDDEIKRFYIFRILNGNCYFYSQVNAIKSDISTISLHVNIDARPSFVKICEGGKVGKNNTFNSFL